MTSQSIPEAIAVMDRANDQVRIYYSPSQRPIRVSFEHANEEIVALSETYHITYHDLDTHDTAIAAPLLPYGWDQVDEADPTWAKSYDMEF